jgi:hypothetical protein
MVLPSLSLSPSMNYFEMDNINLTSILNKDFFLLISRENLLFLVHFS